MKALYRQGAIEDLFRKSMAEKGLKVKHDTVPIALELVQEGANLQDPNDYAAKVSVWTQFNLKHRPGPLSANRGGTGHFEEP